MSSEVNDGEGPRILVLEDEALIAMELETRLRGRGFRIIGPAASAREAIELAALERPDLLLADIRIAGNEDGIDTAHVLRERHGVPVVFLTAHMDDATRRRAIESAPLGYLTKPIRELELVATIEMALHRHRLELALAAKRRELAESEDRFAVLVEQLPDGLLVVDSGGRIRDANVAAATMLGYSRAALTGRVVEDLVPPRERGGHVRLREGFATDVGTRFMGGQRVIKALTAHGREVPVEVRLTKTVVDGETVTLASIRDVSERQEAQRRLREQENELRSAQKLEAIGRLAGGVAHDFNNMLTVVLGVTSILVDIVDEDARALVREVQDAARRSSELTRQLLVFARQEPGAPRAVNVNERLSQLRGFLGRVLGEDVELSFELDEAIARVWIDPSQVDQIVMNLATNARDAMPNGGTLVFRTENVKPRDASGVGRVVLEVSDTGMGMTPETRERIFEPFFTTKDVGKGTGLGLATVYGIATKNGASIEVTSEPDRGSTFRISFPSIEETRGTTGRPPEGRDAAAGSERVLIVEDDAPVRSVMRRSLTRAGYTVLEAECADSALATFEEMGPFQLVIVDVVLPTKSGLVLAQEIRRRARDVSILFVTGYLKEASVLHEHGTLLVKPFTGDVLLRAVRDAIDGGPVRPEAETP
jgi:PAS domain S-box-containing protein